VSGNDTRRFCRCTYLNISLLLHGLVNLPKLSDEIIHFNESKHVVSRVGMIRD
jgi:hypothetical protein